MVDYVMIDEYETPIETLKNIKPDFFAKGFEYTSSGLPPATMEEAEIVKGYGGEMVLLQVMLFILLPKLLIHHFRRFRWKNCFY